MGSFARGRKGRLDSLSPLRERKPPDRIAYALDVSTFYRRAEEAFAKRNYDYACDLYLQIIAMNPNEYDARKKLRQVLHRKYKEQGSPGGLSARIVQSKSLFALGLARKPEAKMEVAQKHLIQDPENAKMRTELARALWELGHKNGAMAEAEIACELDPSNVEAAKILGQAYLAARRISDAAAALERAKKAAPHDRELARLLKDLMANATLAQGFEKADADYRQVLKDRAQSDQLELAQHVVLEESQVDSMLADLERRHAAQPGDANVVRKIAEILFEHKRDYLRAREWYQKLAAMHSFDTSLKDRVEDCEIKSMEVRIAQARSRGEDTTALREEKLRLEIQAYQRRVRDRPTDPGLRFELGRRYYEAGNWDEAISQFQASVKDPRRKCDSHTLLGACFQRKGLYDLAEDQYRRAESVSVTDAQKLQIWYFWARCSEEANKKSEAFELYKRIAERDYGFRDVAQRLQQMRAGS